MIELLQAQDDEELTDEFTAWAAQVVMPRMRRSRPTSRGIDATTTRAPGTAVMAHTKPAALIGFVLAVVQKSLRNSGPRSARSVYCEKAGFTGEAQRFTANSAVA